MTLQELLDVCENDPNTPVGLYNSFQEIDWEEDSDFGPTIADILFSSYYKKYLNCKVAGFAIEQGIMIITINTF